MLAERGFRVVRFDNRDIGHSTMIDSAGMPGRARHDARPPRDRAPYLLSDMADDTFGLMDHLGIDSAHVVGASMGGMIAQTMAIDASRAGPLAGLDDVDHRQPLGRLARTGRACGDPASPTTRAAARPTSSRSSRPSR